MNLESEGPDLRIRAGASWTAKGRPTATPAAHQPTARQSDAVSPVHLQNHAAPSQRTPRLRPRIGSQSDGAFPNIDSEYVFPSSLYDKALSDLAPAPAAHRISLSRARPRRPSPLLHEIHPPSRRLSAHQTLLLTPFGGVVPQSALPVSASHGMSREGSSMTRSATRTIAPGANRDPRLSGSHAMRINQGRGRHHSLTANIAVSSPLTSAPMTTIVSGSTDAASSSGPSSTTPSREASGNNGVSDQMPGLIGGNPGTVPMIRSSSLPVLTLRELEAMKDKDGELGIARGGGWAWVSREENIEEDQVYAHTLSLKDLRPADADFLPRGIGTHPMSHTSSALSPSQPFTAFSDPFASSDPSSTAEVGVSRRSHPPTPTHHAPSATLPGYHYSPTSNEYRRMSDAPSATSLQHSPRSTSNRRPSAPTALDHMPPVTLGRRSAEDPSQFVPEQLALRPPKDPVAIEESPTRPRITRYKSMPGRSQGLGLEILVRPQRHGGSSSSKPEESASRRSSAYSLKGKGKARLSGGWQKLDVVDRLATTDLNAGAPVSPISSGRNSVQSAGSHTSGPNSLTEMLVVEEISSRAHLAEFGHKHGKRGRFESMDAAMSHFGVGRDRQSSYATKLTQAGWNATFPRRGSLAVSSVTAFNSWTSIVGHSGKEGTGKVGEDVEQSFAHWSERRGSWAEGWTTADRLRGK